MAKFSVRSKFYDVPRGWITEVKEVEIDDSIIQDMARKAVEESYPKFFGHNWTDCLLDGTQRRYYTAIVANIIQQGLDRGYTGTGSDTS